MDIKPHSMPVEDILKYLHTSLKGLSWSEAKKRLELFGKNTLEEEEESNILILIRQFNSPLVFILIAAAFITFFMGDYLDSGIITGIILINGLLGFFQEIKAKSSLQSLKKITETKTTVIRGGYEAQIPVSDVVPGDIVVVSEGDIVPADMRLIEATGLLVDEAILTG